jgi:hypothetical protein
MDPLLPRGQGNQITRSEEAMQRFLEAKQAGKSGRLYVIQNETGQQEIAFSPVSKAAIIWDAFLNKIGIRNELKYEVFHASQRDHLIQQFIDVANNILRSDNVVSLQIFERVLNKLQVFYKDSGLLARDRNNQINEIRDLFLKRIYNELYSGPNKPVNEVGRAPIQDLRSAMKTGPKPPKQVKIADIPTSHFFRTEDDLHYDKAPPDKMVASREDVECEINLLTKNLKSFYEEHPLDIDSPENIRIIAEYRMRIDELTKRLHRHYGE